MSIEQGSDIRLIALNGITACLLTNSSRELMDEGYTDQIIALVRARILENILNRAIEALDATHQVQEREEEDLRELIAKASEQLSRQPSISTEDLANTLQVDVEDLAEALEAGVQRQLLDVHHRYTPRAPGPSMPTAATDAPPEDEEPPETANPDSQTTRREVIESRQGRCAGQPQQPSVLAGGQQAMR